MGDCFCNIICRSENLSVVLSSSCCALRKLASNRFSVLF
uniref:Uncharacterized protein n=1 Tax=Anguilla anguilla TaxID=7936 RepID=A0A0E9QBR3_ANGAN